MKKLLIINTLPENAPAVSPALEVLRGGAEEVRVIHTYEKNLRPCIGCNACWLDRPEMMSDSPCVRGNCSTPEMGEISLTSNPRSKARQFSERGRFISFATI